MQTDQERTHLERTGTRVIELLWIEALGYYISSFLINLEGSDLISVFLHFHFKIGIRRSAFCIDSFKHICVAVSISTSMNFYSTFDNVIWIYILFYHKGKSSVFHAICYVFKWRASCQGGQIMLRRNHDLVEPYKHKCSR